MDVRQQVPISALSRIPVKACMLPLFSSPFSVVSVRQGIYLVLRPVLFDLDCHLAGAMRDVLRLA